MPLIDIIGVQVNFPFDPYPCQVTYMEKVIKCLQDTENGILESPTGTGKTLCLLCASLAWQETRKAQTEFNRQVSVSGLMGDTSSLSASGLQKLAKNLEKSSGSSWGGTEFSVPKIIYASRTHSQLSQVVQELKRTAYNSVKVSIIGSREQLCIDEQVKKELSNTAKVHMCRAKVSARTCYYYNHLDDLKKNSEPRVMMGSVVDIEDLVSFGQKNKVCPYYMARDLKSDADIIFMPYNYLLDPKTRKAHGVELQGNVIIFDEAHNLEKICEESSSFDLKPGDLATAIEEVVKMSEKFVAMIKSADEVGGDYEESNIPEPDFTLDDMLRLKATLTDLEEHIDQIAVPDNGKGLTKPGMFIFELLSKASIVYETKNLLIDLLDKVVGYITTDASGSGAGVSKGSGLTKVADILKIIFSQEIQPGDSLLSHQENICKSYKVHIQLDDAGKRKKKQMDLWTNAGGSSEKQGKTLSYWCFSPGHSMADLKAHGVKCLILTSGTLSPMASFTTEMQIPFPVQLENPHVIEKHQVWIGTLRKGPDGTTLNSNYETRFTPSYQSSLGNAVVNFARVVPNGLLIFYPSYPVMEKCLEFWKEQNIWMRIEQYKQIFVEPKAKGILNEIMDDYYKKINDQTLNGAIFIAVCRGKVSEGLDFSDINGRAVMITGLPYPPYMDPKVVLKMQYLDEMRARQGHQGLSGKAWYKQQASRAVNQAIGRVIRHKEDFGAIILCDTRFAASDAIQQLPVWVRPYVNKYDNFGSAIKDAMMFFKTAEKTLPVPRPTRRREPAGAQSSGAYFMPTMSRSREPVGVVQASNVAQHVPSLKMKARQGQDDSTNVSSLKMQYNTVLTSKMAASTPRSLFDALNQTQASSSHDKLSESQIPSYQAGGGTGPVSRRPPTKKKIIIKKRDSNGSSEIVREVTSSVTQNKIFTAETYIAEVKKALSPDDYKLFSRSLVEYKKTENLDEVVSVLGTLFLGTGAHQNLFRNFSKFVRPNHKQQFNQTCIDLTGQSTGLQPQDMVSKKRLLQETETANKKQRVGGTETCGALMTDNKNSKANSKTNTVCNPTVKSLITSSSYGVEKSLSADDVTENQPKGETITCEQKTFDRVRSDHSQSQCSGGGQGPLAVKFPTPGSGSASGHMCCLCQKEAKLPFQSSCTHVCCMNCWRQVFEGDKLCPQCHSRVRRRYLTRLLFHGSSSENQSDSLTVSQNATVLKTS